MKPAKASLLLHPVFVISVILLSLNDFYWKYEYGNWLTGKLSDFAGLVVFPIFLTEVFKKISKTFIIIFTVLFFAWWKSPLSQTLINLFSSVDIQLHRTIDYTDLFAMAVLPFVYFLKPINYTRFPSLQKTLKQVIGVVAFFALCADTPYRMLPYDRYPSNEIRYSEEFCWVAGGEEVLQDLRNKGLTVSAETERYYPLYPSYQELFYRIQTKDSSVQWKPISFTPDSIVYVKQRLYSLNYLVSEYRINDQVLKNIRFRLEQGDGKGKKICVQMISFESMNGAYETHPDKKTRKRLKKYFQSLFSIQPK